ncbi:MAG: toll/interleukin-1 receptor domain-containing protein [Defluviitaleaceae bacterium]|nr:toll/interleukin-1 receptor domain-containing protein [Defluviitaleaceae bacterium]
MSTIFFSHSTRDRDIILPIKNKIDEITGSSLDIFLSSDEGESINAGVRWRTAIESALSNTKILFAFVTQNSVNSIWVNYEIGYANALGVRIVPVGIKFDIAQLQTPLEGFQGFNINSHNDLNRLITTLNSTFDRKHPKSFSETDFAEFERNCDTTLSKSAESRETVVEVLAASLITEEGNKCETDIISHFYGINLGFEERALLALAYYYSFDGGFSILERGREHLEFRSYPCKKDVVDRKILSDDPKTEVKKWRFALLDLCKKGLLREEPDEYSDDYRLTNLGRKCVKEIRKDILSIFEKVADEDE